MKDARKKIKALEAKSDSGKKLKQGEQNKLEEALETTRRQALKLIAAATGAVVATVGVAELMPKKPQDNEENKAQKSARSSEPPRRAERPEAPRSPESPQPRVAPETQEKFPMAPYTRIETHPDHRKRFFQTND